MQITSSRKILISLNKRSEDKNGLVKKKMAGESHGFSDSYLFDLLLC